MRKEDVESLADQVAESPLPVVIYPEGTRTRDGRIARFKRAGLTAILAARRWEVRVVTIDGYWQLRTLDDFLTGPSRIEGHMRVSETLTSPDPAEVDPHDPASVVAFEERLESFITKLEGRMRSTLGSLRDREGALDGSTTGGRIAPGDSSS